MTHPEPRVPLTALPRELSALIDGQPPSYRRLYNLAVDTRIPADLIDGRWQVARSSLPVIIATLGLWLKEAAPAQRSGRKVARH